jgi:hypothetical protein
MLDSNLLHLSAEQLRHERPLQQRLHYDKRKEAHLQPHALVRKGRFQERMMYAQ